MLLREDAQPTGVRGVQLPAGCACMLAARVLRMRVAGRRVVCLLFETSWSQVFRVHHEFNISVQLPFKVAHHVFEVMCDKNSIKKMCDKNNYGRAMSFDQIM